MKLASFYSVELVLDWESDHGPAVHLHAGVDHETIVIIPEEAPATHHPAAEEACDGRLVDEEVPEVDGEVLEETSLGGGNAKGGNKGEGRETLLLVLLHIF